MSITTKDIKAIKADLAKRRQARLKATDDRDLSIKDTILRLAPELRRMKKRGFTTSEMIEALKENGLNIKGATLNRYLAEVHPPEDKSANVRRKNKKASYPADPKSDEASTIIHSSVSGNSEPPNHLHATAGFKTGTEGDYHACL
jgi:E3 ubiquitin-protein ligase DOA10